MNKFFENNWNSNYSQLKDLIPLIFKQKSHPLCEWLYASRRNYHEGNFRLGCAQAAYVKLAIEDLQKVKGYDSEIFAFFKRELKRPLPSDTYFGLRLELRIASSLVSKRLNFQKSEAPDFIITGRSTIGIECTSCHLQLGKTHELRDLTYKLDSAIKNKSKYTYQTSNNILAVDISNLLFHEGKCYFPVNLADKDLLKKKLTKNLEKSAFQSVIAFSYSWTPTQVGNGATLHNFYWRYDKSSISETAQDFLNDHFPKGDFWIEAHQHEKV